MSPPRRGLLHHSDRDSQYTAGDYQRLLSDRGMTVSMSRKGDCWDNAVIDLCDAKDRAVLS